MTNRAAQRAVGLTLAALVFGSWLLLQILALFLVQIDTLHPLLIMILVATLCWLDVGLFIIAHDAMHGSLAPGSPRLNRVIGTVMLAAYAGFSFDRLRPKHMAHHLTPGTVADPDFCERSPANPFRWYVAFFREYFGWREVLVLTLLVGVMTFAARVPYANLLLFWALPAILASVQLFLFGTFLPHAHRGPDFVDGHRARSSNFGWITSLLTCYHFGYHHEHHLHPHLPWWRLPSARCRG
ncbi:fatty acid desaturase [Sphingomonas sp. SRS2]|uniref:fatty acid desaturase n=1 Tax=Sphingomonas sp. SRS2 TaxID=133190 RepID=UPI00061840BC|nr:fatty acid desaturase [Sphingomonas sp. SRS2]KKC26039.1 beta-carotene ketolase [Sphingomonas sp. SRS2]